MNIKDIIFLKTKGWKERLLSPGGKEVLLKSVASAIPLYAMSCFQFPQNCCNEMNSALARFWWGEIEMRALAPFLMILIPG